MTHGDGEICIHIVYEYDYGCGSMFFADLTKNGPGNSSKYDQLFAGCFGTLIVNHQSYIKI